MIDDLRAVLTSYPASAQPLSPLEPLGNAGGASGASLWRFRAGRGLLVVRAWPSDGPDRKALERIHGWLIEASGLGFLPVPLTTLDGRTLLSRGGRHWELDPWLTGAPDLSRPPSRPKLRTAFASLGAIHQRLAQHQTLGRSPGLARRLTELDGLRLGDFNSLERVLARCPDDPAAAIARRWLIEARPLAPAVAEAIRRAGDRSIPLQPCLRDARPDHWLFDGDRLTGIVDFGAMAVDTVAGDLARLLSEWVGGDPPARADALESYTRVRPLDEAETALIPVFERSAALLGAGHWARWHFLDGRTFDDPSAVLSGLRRGLERLEELAADQRWG